jgi:photosystem II stability/assembly factor-like uncharacterized protein
VDKIFLTVDFADENRGIAAGDWGKIVMTDDGGKNWIDVSLEEDILLYGSQFVGRNEAWMAAEMGALFHSIDGGRTWEKIEVHDTTLFGISFNEKGDGVAVGLEGYILHTADGGKTWERQNISEDTSVFKKSLSAFSTSTLYDVVLSDARGLAVGDAGTVVGTKDGGKTWFEIEPPEDVRMNWLGCAASLGDYMVIAGRKGSIKFLEGSRFVEPIKK